MTSARDRYPNLAALAEGVISGPGPSPAARAEAGLALAELDRVRSILDDLAQTQREDYWLRGFAVFVVLVLVGWFLMVARFGGGLK